MKQVNILKNGCKPFWFLALLVFSFMPGIAQNDSTKANEEAAVSPTVSFITVQKSDNSIDLKATYKAKIKGTLTKLPGLHIMFYAKTDSADKEVGMGMTDRNGIATINIKADDVAANKDGKLHFKASFDGNKNIEASNEELTIKRARLEMTPVKEDSVLSVKLKLVDLSADSVAETGLNVYVKRMFNPLKLGEGKTDESGEAVVEIPNNLPGDAKGNITLLARVEDNDQYGNLEATAVEPWGVPVSDAITKMPRALWSTSPPLWMLITFIILVTTVWGHYIVIIYELFRLRKEHPAAEPTTSNKKQHLFN